MQILDKIVDRMYKTPVPDGLWRYNYILDKIYIKQHIIRSTSSSGVSEVATALRRRQKKPHALRMPQKKRGT